MGISKNYVIEVYKSIEWMKDKMVNDAQVQSPPNLDVRGDERTNEKCNVNRSVKILEYKVWI